MRRDIEKAMGRSEVKGDGKGRGLDGAREGDKERIERGLEEEPRGRHDGFLGKEEEALEKRSGQAAFGGWEGSWRREQELEKKGKRRMLRWERVGEGICDGAMGQEGGGWQN